MDYPPPARSYSPQQRITYSSIASTPSCPFLLNLLDYVKHAPSPNRLVNTVGPHTRLSYWVTLGNKGFQMLIRKIEETPSQPFASNWPLNLNASGALVMQVN